MKPEIKRIGYNGDLHRWRLRLSLRSNRVVNLYYASWDRAMDRLKYWYRTGLIF